MSLSIPYLIFHLHVTTITRVSTPYHSNILYIAGQLFLIKGVYSSTNEQTYHVISTTHLGTDTKVTKMTLKGSGADAYVYIGTENGIYRVPTADCACFTDCCSCVSARDPYCTYSLTSHTCRAVGSTNSDRENLLQDFARGNSSLCFAAAMSTDSTSNSDTAPSSNGNDCSTGVATTTVATTELGTDQPGTTITYVTGMSLSWCSHFIFI